MKSAKELKDISIIILTTRGQEEDQRKGIELGARAYIPKPINASDFINTVKEVLMVK